jgi:2-succinyl-5-enolpyruvyl-6-hydroxy-3-cyclohexene-1-carboxylate synthase
VFASQLAAAVARQAVPSDPAWLSSWRAADAAAAAALKTWFAALSESFEGAVPLALDAALPDEAVVVAGNSMPVRDIDAFLPSSSRARRLLGNRGANGIDGLLSTAFGAAIAQAHPLVAVVGDISFLHDLNAFVAAGRLGVDATVVLVQNDGGGIFSFLPQAMTALPGIGLPEHYEELFGTPHGIEFGPLVEALGARHRLVEADNLADALATSLSQHGVQVLELRTGRPRNVELHRHALEVVAAAVEPLK